MSGFTGKTVTSESVPGDVAGTRGDFASWLGSQGFDKLATDSPDLEPYRRLFEQQNARTFAQAKESVGNLTGTGLTNTLGNAAAQASTSQGAFLADLLSRTQAANADRFAGVLTPFLNTGVGPPQQSYQPGFLDYLTQGAMQIGTAYAGRGR